MNYQELPTPALTIDLDILECNLDRMAAYCREHRIGLRPHTKTHKVPEVARMQVERGAVGLTVAKVGEAEVMAGARLDDILIAFPIWGEEKLRRIAAIARDIGTRPGDHGAHDQREIIGAPLIAHHGDDHER